MSDGGFRATNVLGFLFDRREEALREARKLLARVVRRAQRVIAPVFADGTAILRIHLSNTQMSFGTTQRQCKNPKSRGNTQGWLFTAQTPTSYWVELLLRL